MTTAVGASVALATATFTINTNNQNNGGAGYQGQSQATLNIAGTNDGHMHGDSVRSAEVPNQEDVTAETGCDIVVVHESKG